MQHACGWQDVERWNQYMVLRTLGRGSSGLVKLCASVRDGALYAIKVSCAQWSL